MKYLTVGISGKSGSGKTYFLKKLMFMLNYASYSYIDLDGYHKHKRRERQMLKEFPEDIHANDIQKIISDIKKIKKGLIIKTPTYNHHKGDFGTYLQVIPKPIIFVEGLHTALLNDIAGEKVIDFNFYLNPSPDLQRTWKVHRDVLDRGYKFNAVMNEINGRKEFEKKYVTPQIQKSDVVIKVNKVNWLIKHFLLLAKPSKLIRTEGINKLYYLEEFVEYNKDYFQLFMKKEYSKHINEIDKIGMLNKLNKIKEDIDKYSIENIVQISLGLIFLSKFNNHG